MLAIVLSRKDFREYDQIISSYTLEQGKIESLAKGVKKINSKNSASLEPFSFVEIEIVQGKEIDRLAHVVPINYFSGIRSDLNKMFLAQNSATILDKILEVGLPEKEIFWLLNGWLDFLENNQPVNNILLDAFSVKLLRILGFDIMADHHSASFGQKEFKIFLENDWSKINELNWSGDKQIKMHKIVYDFMVFQTDKKLSDWAKTCLL